MSHPEMDEDFLQFESKVDQVMKLLQDVGHSGNNTVKEDIEKIAAQAENINEDDFVVKVRQNRTIINNSKNDVDNKASQRSAATPEPAALDKFTFMEQVEKDAEERTKARLERERIAHNFRTVGNNDFRKGNFEKAILNYTKAIEQIKDSPILYNNRALSYIKLKNYKRAIIDCDYILNKLEEKNLRAWLYRAIAYKRLNDEQNFETCIRFARKHNSKQTDYIDNFLKKLDNF